jgi:hypothetical protein
LLAQLLVLSLHHDVAAWCLCCCWFFPRPCWKSLPVAKRRPCSFPNAGKVFRSLKVRPFTFPISEKSAPWSETRSCSREWGNVKHGNAIVLWEAKTRWSFVTVTHNAYVAITNVICFNW